MANAATDDLAQHVAASFVRRQHAIGNQEGCGARVVGDDAQRSSLMVLLFPVLALEFLVSLAFAPVSSAARLISGTNKSVS